MLNSGYEGVREVASASTHPGVECTSGAVINFVYDGSANDTFIQATRRCGKRAGLELKPPQALPPLVAP